MQVIARVGLFWKAVRDLISVIWRSSFTKHWNTSLCFFTKYVFSLTSHGGIYSLLTGFLCVREGSVELRCSACLVICPTLKLFFLNRGKEGRRPVLHRMGQIVPLENNPSSPLKTGLCGTIVHDSSHPF